MHIIDSIEIAGAEKLLCNTIKELPEYKHVVVTLFPSGSIALLPENAEHYFLGAKKITDLPLKAPAFKRILKKIRPHLVHAHLYFATIFSKWLVPASIPLVFTQHFEFSKNAPKWHYRFIDRILSRKDHCCIAVSESVLKDYLETTLFKGDTYVIGNFIPGNYFAIERNRPAQAKSIRLVSVGNIKKIKNQQFILDAFSFLKDMPACCDIYGDGPEKEELARDAVNRDLNVNFKGSIDDTSTVLGNYDLFIMPSLTEGFPLALFEAMASGLPVIVSDIPVFHEVLSDEGNYISLNKPDQLRLILEKYYLDVQLLSDHGFKMKQLALEKAGKEIYLQKLRTVYNSLHSSI
ncbi:MAG: glycosyltransferase family 4 protein [Bacteroidia bacterium]